MVVCPNNQNRLIGEETMSIGIIDQTKVYPSEVLSAALKHHARSEICMHNHRSGWSKPPRADITVIRDTEKALTVIGSTLNVHLIIADTKCVSCKSLDHF